MAGVLTLVTALVTGSTVTLLAVEWFNHRRHACQCYVQNEGA